MTVMLGATIPQTAAAAATNADIEGLLRHV